MAEVKIIWSEEALKDIEEIISFISKDSELYAVNFGHLSETSLQIGEERYLN